MKLLFELYTEELPNSEMVHLEESMVNLISDTLKRENILFDNLKFYLTPTRMVIKFEFDKYTKPNNKKLVGPPKSICYKNGKPTKALEGFLKKSGVDEKDIVVEKTKKGEYIVAIIRGEVVEAKPVVVQALKDVLYNIHFNKKMRWGEGNYEFVRPVHGIVFLIDNEVVDFEFMGKKSSAYTFGHRFMSEGEIKVDYDNYESKLKEHFVIVDANERKDYIIDELERIASKRGAKLVYDDDLLEEVANLVEYPVVVVGNFDERFLKLPKEVLITSMRDHQRYFAFVKDGKLLNIFGAVSNIKADNMGIIRDGYERVLKARFSDAEFFFEEDKRFRLEEFVGKLDGMLFHEKLGSQLDRTNRLVQLSGLIANRLGFDEYKAKRAAFLSKADLMTQMVYEFPELQGVMGREYALLSQEDKEVAQAIYEQYLPRENEIPMTEAGICLSIADKIDVIVGGFFADLKPTGAKDPYGLRRSALGIIKTLIDNKLFLNLDEIISKSAYLYDKRVNLKQIKDFFKVRFRNLHSDIPYDIVEAVTFRFEDIYDAYLRLKALYDFVRLDQQKEKQFAIKRVFNILKDFNGLEVNESIFSQAEEKNLFNRIKNIENKLTLFLDKRDYYGLLEEVSSMRQIIDAFFDSVMVMDDNKEIRNNRLSILNRLRKVVLNIADFKFLEI